MGGYCISLRNGNALGREGQGGTPRIYSISLRNGNALEPFVDRVRLNEESKARNERLWVLRAELQQEGAALEQLQREAAKKKRDAEMREEIWLAAQMSSAWVI